MGNGTNGGKWEQNGSWKYINYVNVTLTLSDLSVSHDLSAKASCETLTMYHQLDDSTHKS